MVCSKWAVTWDFQQCGMCDQQRLRTACAYAQTDQSLCYSFRYSMTVKLLTELHLEFLSLKGWCTCLSMSILVKMPHCWESHVAAQMWNPLVSFVVDKGLIPCCDCVWKLPLGSVETLYLQSPISTTCCCFRRSNQATALSTTLSLSLFLSLSLRLRDRSLLHPWLASLSGSSISIPRVTYDWSLYHKQWWNSLPSTPFPLYSKGFGPVGGQIWRDA